MPQQAGGYGRPRLETVEAGSSLSLLDGAASDQFFHVVLAKSPIPQRIACLLAGIGGLGNAVDVGARKFGSRAGLCDAGNFDK